MRDSFLKAAFDSAGLPLLQIPASSHYQVEELREQILPLLSGPRRAPDEDLLPGIAASPPSAPATGSGRGGRASPWRSCPGRGPIKAIVSPRSAPLPAADAELVENLFAEVEDEENDEHPHQVPHCPRCDAPLVEREAKKGPHAGRLFLACSRFPECRYAAPHTHARH